MNYKIFTCLFLLSFLYACRSSKELVVKLSPNYDVSTELGQTFWQTTEVTAENSLLEFARRQELDSFILTHFLHRPWEQQYFEWKEGKRDSASYAATFARFNGADSIPANLLNVDGESLFLFGRKKTGEYVVVADENNNNSFADDSVRTVIPITGKKDPGALPTLPTVRLSNLQGVRDGKMFTFSTIVQLRPTVNKDMLDSTKSHLYLNLVSSAYNTGQFRYSSKKYKIAVRDKFYPVLSNAPHHLAVKLAEGKDDSAFHRHWSYRPEYSPGDTMVLKGNVFAIKSVSPMRTQITLQPLRVSAKNVRPKEINQVMLAIAARNQPWVGKPFPSFHVQQGDELLSPVKLKGKVLFINFWFAACPPCIAEFEALSKLYDNLKDRAEFQFISFTFESPDVVEKVKKKYGLRFPVYSISREECEKLNVGKGYPTNIIVDKNGIIKQVQTGGETDKEAAKAYIENGIYKRILQEL